MAERDLDDLFRELGDDKPYWGSDDWKKEMERNKRARQLVEEFARRVKNKEPCNEDETRAQLAALGQTFDPWPIPGWHR